MPKHRVHFLSSPQRSCRPMRHKEWFTAGPGRRLIPQRCPKCKHTCTMHTQSTQSTHRHTSYLHAHIYTCTDAKNTKCIHTHTRYTYTKCMHINIHTHTQITHIHTHTHKVHKYTQSTCSKTHTQIMKSTQVEI